MTKVEKIKKEIKELTEEEYRQIRNWMLEVDWKKWDEEIESDSLTGKLNFLIEEAKGAKKEKKLKEL